MGTRYILPSHKSLKTCNSIVIVQRRFHNDDEFGIGYQLDLLHFKSLFVNNGNKRYTISKRKNHLWRNYGEVKHEIMGGKRRIPAKSVPVEIVSSY